MQAKDIMTTPVVTEGPEATVRDIAKLLLEHRISGVPIVDGDDRLLGIVSEGDLLHRTELGTEYHRKSWWLSFVTDTNTSAREFVKSHATKVADLMTKDVTSVSEDTPMPEIAGLMDTKKVRRLPVLKDGKVVGIISRVNILQGLAVERETPSTAPSMDDRSIRANLMGILNKEQWAQSAKFNVIVSDGVVHLYGVVRSEEQRRALCVAAESVDGVNQVEDHLAMLQTHPQL